MILFENMKIYIQEKFDCNAIEMWIVETDGMNQYNISYNSESGIERTEIDQRRALRHDESIKPFLRLPAPFARGFFRKIAEYNDKNGIKTADQNLLEGKLMAKEEHLKDMQEFARKLLDASLSVMNNQKDKKHE